MTRFARKRLFEPAGMTSAMIEPDEAGVLVGSSYAYATARDWARYGLLHLNHGRAGGKQLLSRRWLDFAVTPTAAAPLPVYGAQLWLNRPEIGGAGRQVLKGVPGDAFMAMGHNHQIVAVIPSQDAVIVRLGWTPEKVVGILQDIVTERPGPDGTPQPCDTWDNAVIHSWARHDGAPFPLTTETKRIAPGQKNTWEFEAIGMDGGVRFSTKNPKAVEVFGIQQFAALGREQVWQQLDSGSQSVWPTVTGPNFEFGFSDSILQMWAVYLAERHGSLDGRFGAARPDEAALTHDIYAAAITSHAEARAVNLD